MSNEDLTHRTLIAPAFLPDAEALDSEPDGSDEQQEELLDSRDSEDSELSQDSTEAPAAKSEPAPPGDGLADLLAEGLKRRGWAVDYRWTTYDGHAFDAKRKDLRYDVEVRCLDVRGPDEVGAEPSPPGPGRWLVSAKRRTGFFKNFFQGRSDPAEHALLRLHIDESLGGDPRTVEAAAAMTPWTTEREAGG